MRSDNRGFDFDVAIVGAGAAGLTAAIYARRAGLKTVVFEKLVAGGQIVNAPKIANYPATPGISGAEWAKTLAKQAVELGADLVYDEVLELKRKESGFVLRVEDREISARAVIVATGLVERRLRIPGEERLLGKGVSFCATCDGAFYQGKDVAVVGGGNSALSSAIYLAGLARKVYLVHRREEFRGDFALQEKVRGLENVELVLGCVPEEIVGEKKVTGLKISDGRELAVEGVFVAVGKVPANQLIKDLVELDEGGYAVTDEKRQTKTPGLFVAGDGRTEVLRQLVTATADGAVAASGAREFLVL